jgi:uncharacterized protein
MWKKMLYDNAPLLGLYVDAWLLTGDPLFKSTCEQTADWVVREMQSAQGGYYSSLDADSEREEGKFYVWSREEFAALLAADEYAVACAYFGLDRPANFEVRAWNLCAAEARDGVAAKTGHTPGQCQSLLQTARAKLLAARDERVRPGRDEKILASWNALLVEGMIHAARIFGRSDWRASASRAMGFLRARMWKQRLLLAAYKDDRAHLNAYLDDYAFLLVALLEKMQAEWATADLQLARALADALLERFEDPALGGFFFTSDDHEPLILRPKSGADNAIPSGNGIAARALTRLGHLLGEQRYLRAAERTVRFSYPEILRQPGAYSTLCLALEEVLEPTRINAMRGPCPALGTWQQALARRYLPDVITIALDSTQSGLPGALDKPASPAVNAYLCRGVNWLGLLVEFDSLAANLEACPPA